METLLVVPQHRNQYYGRSKAHGSDRFVSSPSSDFREINCRTFESGAGILPTPLKACTTPIASRPKQLEKAVQLQFPLPRLLTMRSPSMMTSRTVSSGLDPLIQTRHPLVPCPYPNFRCGQSALSRLTCLAPLLLSKCTPSPSLLPLPQQGNRTLLPEILLTLQLRISGEFSISISRMIEVRGAPCSCK
ncbi:unnamed protein product, partial [Vitis vinifera]